MPSLARDVKKQLAALVDRRLAPVRRKVARLEERIESLEQKIGKKKERIDALTEQLRQAQAPGRGRLPTTGVFSALPLAPSTRRITFSLPKFLDQRKRLGLTQREMAMLFSVTPQTIANYVTGATRPHNDQLRRLPAFFSLAPADVKKVRESR